MDTPQKLAAFVFATAAAHYFRLITGNLQSVILIQPLFGGVGRPFIWTRLVEWSTTVPIINLSLLGSDALIERQDRNEQAMNAAFQHWLYLWGFLVAMPAMAVGFTFCPTWLLVLIVVADYIQFVIAMSHMHDSYIKLRSLSTLRFGFRTSPFELHNLVSGLLVQQVSLVHTNTDYCLPTFYTWIPTTRSVCTFSLLSFSPAFQLCSHLAGAANILIRVQRTCATVFSMCAPSF
jgi:hypothetical protein